MKKILLFFIVCISYTTLYGQKFFSFTINPQCDSLTGFFYLYSGYTINNKFRKKDNRDNSGFGFFYGNERSFNGDTLFIPVDSNSYSEDWVIILDSVHASYKKYRDSDIFLDSIIKKYAATKSIKINTKRTENDKAGTENSISFIRLKMKIVYNNSYLKQQNLPRGFCFNKEGEIIECRDLVFYYKPILEITMLE